MSSKVPLYSRRRTYGSAVTHQNRLFSANVVIFRRIYWSYRREKEGGWDPVRERVNSVLTLQVSTAKPMIADRVK